MHRRASIAPSTRMRRTSCGRDNLSGRLQSLARNTPRAFELLRLAVTAARLDAERFERVVSQIAAGLKREANDPDFVAGRNFRAAAYPNHPYGLPVRGDLSTLPALTRSHLIDLRAVTFARDNLEIAAVGAINAETLTSHLDDIFGQLPEKAGLIPVAPAAFVGAGTLHVARIDVPQSTIRFGREGIARTDPDFIAATVVNHILGGGIFSRVSFARCARSAGLPIRSIRSSRPDDGMPPCSPAAHRPRTSARPN